ncbi:30 kDa heat shock protein [Blumeria hordei DH14]|uniref:30 kDa heat shock protein n=1 Tax=Blumeria graminis f. sp. hordei (strain DH14) TaxID=546991 RepID=N1JGP3_BLUG1|nr:30 kDa heat shock protein [Blumeria hordei DH14]
MLSPLRSGRISKIFWPKLSRAAPAMRKMSFFPRSFITGDQSTLPPIFRLLDEVDQYSRRIDRSLQSRLQTFTPKFDVKELTEAFELHGELPGIEQKDVDIEFTDASTLTIRGRSESSQKKDVSTAGSAEERSPGDKTANVENRSQNKTLQATVEDAEGSQKDMATVEKSDGVSEPPNEKFWVMERSVGEFSRSFSFPVRVDQENVRASMKNGVLSIIIPKLKKHESRKIHIE